MNKYTLKELQSITNIINTKNVLQDTIFDFMRITVDDNKAKEVLFFPVTLDDYYIKDCWISQAINQKEKIMEYIKFHPEYTFVVEEDMLNKITNPDAKLIIVPNIMKMIEDIFDYTLSKNTAQVIEVTGSVGKTSTVGLIEQVLAKKYRVLRIYHKRITPCLLRATIINNLTEDIEYIVSEVSLYYKNHVEVLSSILKPNISIIINIDSSHIHNDGMHTLKDLCISKSSLLKYPTLALINQSDEHLQCLKLQDGYLYYEEEKLFATNLEQLNSISINDNPDIDKIISFLQNYKHSFYISELSLIQLLMAYKIAILKGIDEKEIFDAFAKYVPVENRLQQKNIFNKNIYFDGDISTYERMKQLSKHKYQDLVLIIRKFGSAEIPYTYEGVPQLFQNFKKVYIFNDIEYLPTLTKADNVEIVSNHDFFEQINEPILYHYSGYYRSFKSFNENNLIELENTIYKIITPKEG